MLSNRLHGAHRWWGLAIVAGLLLAAVGPATWAAPAAIPARTVLAESSYPGLDSPDPAVRAAAVQEIRRVRDVAAVNALIEHLDDPDQRVGLYIAQALVELADNDSPMQLTRALAGDDANGRWRAALVLGERREFRAVPLLARTLHDREVLVARHAAEALAKIGTWAAVKELTDSLGSPWPSEVHAAMGGLLLMGNAAVSALTLALDSGIIQVELNAATVLEAIGTPAAWAALHNDGSQ